MQACSYCYPKPKHLVICVIVGYSVTVLIPVLVKLTTPSLFQSFGVDSGEGRLAPSIFGIVIRVLLSQHEQMFHGAMAQHYQQRVLRWLRLERGLGFRVYVPRPYQTKPPTTTKATNTRNSVDTKSDIPNSQGVLGTFMGACFLPEASNTSYDRNRTM